MHLVDHNNSQITEQLGFVHPLGDEHHLQGFGGGHQQLGRLLEELAAGGVVGVAMPHEAAQTHHFGVEPEALCLVVEQGLDRRDVKGANAIRGRLHHLGDGGEHGGFGLAAGRRRQDHRVGTSQQRLAGLLLHRAQAAPAQPGDDRLLQPGRQAGEDAHTQSPASSSRELTTCLLWEPALGLPPAHRGGLSRMFRQGVAALPG